MSEPEVVEPQATPIEPVAIGRSDDVDGEMFTNGELDDEIGFGEPQSRTARNAALAVGVVVAALIALLALSGGDDAATRSALVGRRVPVVAGSDINGQAFHIDDLRGQWVVVNFFATWCPPCVAEHPELVAVDEWGRQRGDVELVSIVFNDDDEAVRRFFDQQGGSWPVISGSTAAVDFQVSQIPETFVVAPNGQVVAHMAGETTAEQILAVVSQAGDDVDEDGS